MSAELPNESEETEQLLRKIAGGDREAWTRLLASHEPYLQRLVSQRLDSRMQARVDVADVLQETHMQASDRILDYLARRPMPFRLWLRKTAFECMLQLRRKHVIAQTRSVDREASLPCQSSVIIAERLLDNATSPSGKVVKQEIGQQIREAVDELSEVDREILILRAYEGLTNAEAASVLGIERDASRKRYARALLRLSEVLAHHGLSEVQTWLQNRNPR